jgi:nucleoside-diphosphate-sugar epimerase
LDGYGLTQRILITGAGGYIGGALCRYLSERQDCEVYATYRNAKPSDLSGRCAWVYCDLVSDLSQLPDNIDVVVHAAACLNFDGIDHDTLKRDNVNAACSLIEFCKENEIRKCIFLSSMSVYGNTKAAVIDEETVLNPNDDYGKFKKITEDAFRKEADVLSTVCIRLPAVVGPKARRIFPARMIDALEEKTTMTFYNPDNLYNHIVDIDDLAKLISSIIDTDFEDFVAFPVSAADPIPMSELVKYVASLLGVERPIEFEIDHSRGANIISSSYAQRKYDFQHKTVKNIVSDYILSR